MGYDYKNKGGYTNYISLDEGWCATFDQIIVTYNEGWCAIYIILHEGWYATLHQILYIDCTEGWCASYIILHEGGVPWFWEIAGA